MRFRCCNCLTSGIPSMCYNITYGSGAQLHSAMIQLQPDIIVTRMTNHLTTLTTANTTQEESGTSLGRTNEIQDTGSIVQRQYDMWISSPSWIAYLFGQFEYHRRTRMCKGREINDVNARYKLPDFLSNRVLDFQCHKMLTGWRVDIHTFRMIPFDNPFFEAIENDDITAFRHMLVNKEYLVTDRDEDNTTPLHLAVQHGNVEICRELLLAGADVSIQDCDSEGPEGDVLERTVFPNLALESNFVPLIVLSTPFHTALLYGAVNTFHGSTGAFEICRLLLKEGAIDILVNDRKIFQYFHGSLEMLRFLHREVNHSYTIETSVSAQNRVAVAAWIAKSASRHNTALLVEYWLEAEGSTERELPYWKDGMGRNFLHILAQSFARASCGTIHEKVFDKSLDGKILCQLSTTRNKRCTWRPLLRKAILARCPVVAVDNSGRSILWTLILEFLTERYFRGAPSRLKGCGTRVARRSYGLWC
ncbi:hypothetical protein ONS96_003015 [Cadophora gregata f. sp. sojae]|nr:hypothetical protein ONS96_003015 [Cadophora gregata f. sp. sojae]